MRSRLLGAAAVGGAALAVAGVVALTRGDPPAPVVTGSTLDGYLITWLPPGVARAGQDSVFTARVTDRGLVNDGPGPAPGEPAASVTMRRYDRAGGASFFVTVLRLVAGDPATVGARLLTGATPATTFDTPIGTVRMFSDAGRETTTHRAVIATPDHVVITVEGNGQAPATEIRDLARGVGQQPGTTRRIRGWTPGWRGSPGTPSASPPSPRG